MKKPPKIIFEKYLYIVDLDRLHILNKTGIYTDYDEDEE